MQELSKRDGEIRYYLIYLEKMSRIIVLKNGEPSYLVRVNWSASRKSFTLACDCPAGIWRRVCKHEKYARKFHFDREHEPRTWLAMVAQEFYENWVDVKINGFYNERRI
jgi:hypothetical protein